MSNIVLFYRFKDISEGIEEEGLIYAVTWQTMRDEAVRPQTRRKTASGWKFGRSGKANYQKMEGVTIRAGDKFDLGMEYIPNAPVIAEMPPTTATVGGFLEYNLMTVEEFYFSAYEIRETADEVQQARDYIREELGIKSIKLDGVKNADVIKPIAETLKQMQEEYGVKFTSVEVVNRAIKNGCENISVMAAKITMNLLQIYVWPKS